MASWEDDLKNKLKTPEEKAAEQAQKEAEALATARRAVASALVEIKSAFFKAQTLLAGRTSGQVFVNFDSMNDSSLTVGQRVLSAKAGPDGTSLLIGLDGKELRLIFNRLKGALVREDDQHAHFDLDQYIGNKIKSLV